MSVTLKVGKVALFASVRPVSDAGCSACSPCAVPVLNALLVRMAYGERGLHAEVVTCGLKRELTGSRACQPLADITVVTEYLLLN